MNKQDIKMSLLKEFGGIQTFSFIREAYKFLTEDEDAVAAATACIGAAANTTPKHVAFPFPQPAASRKPVAVDLGLPSGTLWCDRNVGAFSPEDSGAFFSWGNTEPYYPHKTEEQDWGCADDAFDCDFGDEPYGETDGAKLDGDIDLDHDAARVNLGAPWRMPTSKEFQELYDNCDVRFKTFNGVNGLLFKSKQNGASIFFPASGYGSGASLNYRGTDGYYWSATWHSTRVAHNLYFYSGGVDQQYDSNRCYGYAVRPVQDARR